MRPSRALLALCAALLLAPTACDGDPAAADGGSADGGADASSDARPDAGPDALCVPPAPDAGPWGTDACPVALPKAKDLVDQALDKLKLDRCRVIYSKADKAIFPAGLMQDPYRLPFFDPVHGAAFNAPPFAERVVKQLDGAAGGATPVTSALVLATHYAGHGGGPLCLPSSSGLTGKTPLASAVYLMISRAKGTGDLAALQKQAAGVPLQLQRALAPVVIAVSHAAVAREAALKHADLGKSATSPGIDLQTLFTHAASLTLRSKDAKALAPKQAWVQNLLLGKGKGVDYAVLYHAAVELAASVERARLSRFAGVKASFNADTPLGRVVIGGPGNDSYAPKDAKLGSAVALLLETGGDDSYTIPAGATASAQNPISVLVDLGGEDTYGYPEVPSPYDGKRLPSDADGRVPASTPCTSVCPISLSMTSRQGAGRLGVGLLLDLGGDADRYTSLRMSQGFGALGVGVLYDDGGNDTYRGEAGVQGSGIFGLGLLIDAKGDDTFQSYSRSQGFAYVKGVGLLHDAAGKDRYTCDHGDPNLGGDPIYASAQLPGKGNSSFCQGAGFGRRAGTTDQVYMSGGLGILRDAAGNDGYIASVFAQGTGYWFGTGILSDGGGDDSYDGLWYVQGSNAHFALTVFADAAGDDRYNQQLEPKATSIGVGHDFSVSWHLDLGGDDTYRAPGLSLGSGNDNGIGLMVNLGGKDSYATKGKRTLGGASLSKSGATGARAGVINLGLFVDAEGSDTYTIDGAVQPRDNTSWIYQSTNTGPTKEWGVGLDGKGTVSLP